MPIVTRSAYNVRRNAITESRVIEENCRLDQICAICHDNVRGSVVYHLPCGHTFRKECLINQLRHGRQWATKCAVCRRDHREALIQHNELSQYVEPLVEENNDLIFTMMFPLHGNVGQPQQPIVLWSSNEGDDISNSQAHSILVNMMNSYIDANDIEGIEPEGSETSIAGTSIAGTSIAGTSIAGTSIAGTSIAGTSIAGTSIGGTSIGSISDDDMVIDSMSEDVDEESDMSAPDYEYNMFDSDSDDYINSPHTWSGRLYSVEYPAGNYVIDDDSQSSTESLDQAEV